MSMFSRRSLTVTQSRFRGQISDEALDKWELDEAFFSALSKWTLDHPERRIEYVLEVASDAIEQGRDIVEVIPDVLFPVRGFIKAVACLFQLGVKICIAQREVQDFAMEILNWVNRVKASFNQAGVGRFTATTWENLAQMRDLINGICSWAVDRLKDKRWSLANFKTKKEIDEFRARMDEARKLFNVRLVIRKSIMMFICLSRQDLSLIVISGSLSSINQMLWTGVSGQSAVATAIENLRETLDSHLKQILMEKERRRFIKEKLLDRTVKDPSYTAQNKRACHPGTRDDILNEIKDWINDHSEDTSQNALWIVGPPGCGKSTIAASIAEYCQSQGNLGAQFFISHTNRNTTNPLYYFPTVIRDLYRQSDTVEQHLYDTLKERIFSFDTPEKAAQLFLDTIENAASDHPNDPVVVIFDGLDETSSYHDVPDQLRREHLGNTVTVFSDLVSKLSHQHRNAKILISSRPEAEILRRFKRSVHGQNIKELEIRTDGEKSLHDIKKLLRHRLAEIAMKYLPPTVIWPREEHLEQLATAASGLFIWAVTACNYIDARLRLRGKQNPDEVFLEFNQRHQVDLRTLYRRILMFSYPKEAADEWDFEVFRRIMGALMIIQESMNIRNLTAFLDLRRTSEHDHVDIRNFVENLRTVLVTDSGQVTEDTIPQAHKAFFDFLTSADESLPVPLHINIDTANAEMAILCLRHLITAYPDMRDTHQATTRSSLRVLSTAALYSLRYIFSHVPQATGIVNDCSEVRELAQLEAIVNRSCQQNCAGPLAFSVQTNPTFVRTSFNSRSLLWNLKEGSSPVMPISITLDSGHLWFSPDGSRIFSVGADQVSSLQHYSYALSKKFAFINEPALHLIEPSFNGKEVVFSTFDGRIYLQGVDSGALIATLPKRHQEHVTTLKISPKGNYIASASCDASMEIWDVKSGCYISEPHSLRHESPVRGVAFSPDETLFISCTSKRAYLWESSPFRQLCSFEFELGGEYSIAFSPDSQLLLGGSKHGIAYLWKARTGEPIYDPWILNGPVSGVGFRSCGNIAFACDLWTLQIWDVHESTLLRVISGVFNAVFTADGSQLVLEGHSKHSRSLKIYNLAPISRETTSTFEPKWTTFSPQGNLVVSVAATQILCWRLDAVKVVGDPLQGISTFIHAIAFSDNESRIAGASEDGTFYLWDSVTYELLSSLPTCVLGVSSLSFSPNGAHIVATCVDDRPVVLAMTGNGMGVLSDEKEAASVILKVQTHRKPSFFDTDRHVVTFGTDRDARNRRLEGVRWYPSNSDSVVWAYVDGHIIRAGKDGSFVVVPVGDASCK
ncbi:hypothetical protein DXG01_007042 [Tephrocybe rancida]|nr:hypothetical protein DXG01_007042 [Tephrocybe rancida]